MKIAILIAFFFATNLFAQDAIKNGSLELRVNNDLRQTSECETFSDGTYEGIVTLFQGQAFTVTEIDTSNATKLSNEPLSFTQKINGPIASGFCAFQEYISNLKVTYTKTLDEVKFEYQYRCNRKEFTRTLTCKR